MVFLSDHALQRAAQRNLSPDEIRFIVDYAHRERRAGVIFCQLHWKDLPMDELPRTQLQRLVGSTVVLCKCGHYAITLYRAGEAFKRDRRKPKYNALKDFQRTRCPHCQEQMPYLQ